MSPEEKAEWHRKSEELREQRRLAAIEARARARDTTVAQTVVEFASPDPAATLARKLGELQAVIDSAPDRATVVRAVEVYTRLAGLGPAERAESSEREVDLGKLSDEELDALRRDVVRRLGGRVD